MEPVDKTKHIVFKETHTVHLTLGHTLCGGVHGNEGEAKLTGFQVLVTKLFAIVRAAVQKRDSEIFPVTLRLDIAIYSILNTLDNPKRNCLVSLDGKQQSIGGSLIVVKQQG